MSATLQIAIALTSLLVLLGMMALVRRAAQAYGLSAEIQRKLVHIGTGLYALCLPWLFTDRWPVFVLLGLTMLVMLALRLPSVANGGLGAALHGVERQSYGDFMLAIAIGLCFLLSNGQAVLYVLPIAVLTLADAAAALAGSTYGKRFFQVEDGTKSFEGSAIFFLVTLVISMVCLLLLSDVPRPNVIALSLICAAFGALVEADSWQGFDNLFLPMGLLLFLSENLTDTPIELLLLMLGFLVTVISFRKVANHLGLSRHSARVYVIAVFLLMSVTALENMILPLAVLAAHIWARSQTASNARFPDLDIVAGLGLISFMWLGLGNATEMNTIGYYALSNMGMCIGLSAIATSVMHKVPRIGVITGLGIMLGALCLWVIGRNDAASWTGGMLPEVIAVLALCGLVPLAYPARYQNNRVLRISLLALTVPLVEFSILALRQKGWL